MKCPDCCGTGKTGHVHVNFGYDERTGGCRGEWRETMPCLRCKGSGEVSDEMAQWMADGKAMRDARVARGESLMEAARRMGMGSAELSAIEHGRRGSNARDQPPACPAPKPDERTQREAGGSAGLAGWACPDGDET